MLSYKGKTKKFPTYYPIFRDSTVVPINTFEATFPLYAP